jgi:hypothetical protein
VLYEDNQTINIMFGFGKCGLMVSNVFGIFFRLKLQA